MTLTPYVAPTMGEGSEDVGKDGAELGRSCSNMTSPAWRHKYLPCCDYTTRNGGRSWAAVCRHHKAVKAPPRPLVRSVLQTQLSGKPSLGRLSSDRSHRLVRPQSVVLPFAEARRHRAERDSGARALQVRPEAGQDVQLLCSLALCVDLRHSAELCHAASTIDAWAVAQDDDNDSRISQT